MIKNKMIEQIDRMITRQQKENKNCRKGKRENWAVEEIDNYLKALVRKQKTKK